MLSAAELDVLSVLEATELVELAELVFEVRVLLDASVLTDPAAEVTAF